jgi:TRAP-type C4-dicarboxylate transport system permease small subunit
MQQLEKWLGRCEDVLLFVAASCGLAMMALTTADAAGRYLLGSPVTGANELTEKYLMPAMVFLGLGYAYRGGIFIRVTFAADRLPAKLKLWADYASQLISILFCLVLIVASLQQAVRVVGNGTTLSTLEVPLAPAYFLVPLGLAVLVLMMLFDLPRVASGKSRLFKEESPDS